MNTPRVSGWSWLRALSRPMLVLLALQLLSGMVSSPQRTFFPLYAKELGYSTLFISWMATAQRLTGLGAAALGGALSDTLGRERTLLLGHVGVLLAGLVFFTPSAGAIIVLCALSGIGLSFQTLGGQSYLLDNARPEWMGVLTALYNWGYTLGGALGGPLAGLLLRDANYRPFGIALVAASVLTLLINLLLLPRSRASSGRPPPGAHLGGYGTIARRPAGWLLAAMRFLPTFYWGMALILVPLMLDAAGASKQTIALYATVSQVVATIAQLVAGRAADRLGCRLPTLLAFAVLVASVLATALAAETLWGVFVFGTLGAASAWALSTLLPCLVARITPSAERGRVLGWIHLWWNAGMVLGSLTGGALYEHSAGLPFGVAAAGIAAVFLVSAVSLPRLLAQPIEDEVAAV
ncbi:MAG: MFS transporter [Chloroflexi bacterium]|nr:MFS transporter [Chloroflexota bacterium]